MNVFELTNAFGTWLGNLEGMWLILNTPLDELISYWYSLNGAWIYKVLFELMNRNGILADWFQYSLLTVILGGSVFVFIFVTLLKWLLDVIGL